VVFCPTESVCNAPPSICTSALLGNKPETVTSVAPAPAETSSEQTIDATQVAKSHDEAQSAKCGGNRALVRRNQVGLFCHTSSQWHQRLSSGPLNGFLLTVGTKAQVLCFWLASSRR
jgi:hypothetical protein